MTDQQNGSIIRRESSSLSKAAPSGNPLINRMAGDLLSRAKSNQIAQERIQLGDYSFRPPDYRQIMRWATTFRLDPIELLKIFEKTGYFEVTDGAMLSLRWDLRELPTPPSDWEDGILITTLIVRGRGKESKGQQQRERFYITDENLPNLIELDLKFISSATEVEISRLPRLEWLECSSCNLATLTLRLKDFPNLKYLDLRNNELNPIQFCCLPRLLDLRYSGIIHTCRADNKISEFDLMHFPRLKTLEISGSRSPRRASREFQLLNLDLSPVPLLTELNCENNQLKELDLSSTPLLTKLNCSNNQLKKLDLSPTPLLTELDCGNNQLQDLDLKPTSSLESLVCRANQIKELDISQAPQCDTSKDEYDLVDPPYFCCKENPLEKIILTENQYRRLRKRIPSGAKIEVVPSTVTKPRLDS